MRSIEELRRKAIEKAKARVREKMYRPDKLVIEAIDSVNELDSVVNLITERVKSWYAYHFPELEKIVVNLETYLAIVNEIKSRKYMEIAKLAAHTGKAEKIAKIAKQSVGADIPDEDLNQVANLAKLGIDTKRTREELMKYIERTCQKICPNLSYIVGPNLAARLLSHAGGLDKLAEMPASTIQVLGAEKALFAHLRKKTSPPKHGIIFLDPLIKGAPKHLRGKVARVLATKISIAARVDFFSNGKDWQGEILKKELDARVNQIMKLKNKPKPKRKTKKPKRKRGKR